MRHIPAFVWLACACGLEQRFSAAAAAAGDSSGSTNTQEGLALAQRVSATPTTERGPSGLSLKGDAGVSASRTPGVITRRNTGAAEGEGEESHVGEGTGEGRGEGDNNAPELHGSWEETQQDPVLPEEEEVEEEEEEEEGNDPIAEIEGMDEHWTQHASVAQPPGAVLENARSVYSEISSDILTRWGYKYANTPLFSGGMKFSDGGKVVENKMLNAVVEQEGFLAAFTGVSTTAGHDCLFEQSYPVLLNETFGRLMAATGVKFEAINVAMGNTRVAPYSYCVEAHAGLEADLISWDMTLMVASNECGKAAAGIELFVRSATVLPKRPVVLLMDATPNQDVCTNGHLRQIKKLDDGWHAGPTGHLLVADMLFMAYAEVFLRALERLNGVKPGITAAGLRQLNALSANGRLNLWESLGLDGGGATDARPDLHGEATAADSQSGSNNYPAFMGGGRGDILPPPSWCKGYRFCQGAGSYRSEYFVEPSQGHWAVTLNEEAQSIKDYLKVSPPRGFHHPIDYKWVLVGDAAAGPIEFEFETLGIPPAGRHRRRRAKVEEGEEEDAHTFSSSAGREEPAPESAGANEEFSNSAGIDAEKTRPTEDATDFDSRVTVCKPDFIDRVQFNETSGVRFSVDGIQVETTVELVQVGLHVQSCALLDVAVGVGRHTVKVEPLKVGEPYVAISHVLYPA
ncbi:conserved unknown protein [Ectocarpus siliculosus]|uniref:Uncharacterized protein n=1 Tax=Ectocarpus siliculosus TaxID=2880 RepID=D7FPX3_ECTSI|nr:conserved unknown protein [Ectocarpus siliculosus]|eukprot:CBJ48305.1 conserved unknown protein [Ectocarpus siliculosus]